MTGYEDLADAELHAIVKAGEGSPSLDYQIVADRAADELAQRVARESNALVNLLAAETYYSLNLAFTLMGMSDAERETVRKLVRVAYYARNGHETPS